MGGRGLEQSAFLPPKRPISETERTESGTVDARKSAQEDPDLRRIVAAWPYLTGEEKRSVLKRIEDGERRARNPREG